MQSFLSFAIPLLAPFEIATIGRLFLPEIILLALLIPLVVMRTRVFDGRARMFIMLGLIWLASQVVSDLVVGSVPADYLRGWAKIAFMLLNFAAILALTQARFNTLSVFAVGAALGSLLTMAVRPPEYALSDPWKFGYGFGVTLLLVLAGSFFSSRKPSAHAQVVPLFFLVALSAANLALGFRSLAGMCALAAVIAILSFRGGTRGMKEGNPVKRAAVAAGTLAIGGLLFMGAYQFAAQSGMLGEEAREKHESQGLGDYGLLLGGRTEVLVAADAISESPIVGHGSWARDPKYALLLTQIRSELGYDPMGESEWDLIPTHSHFLGAWVEAGILGAVFWIWVMALVLAAVLGLGRIPTVHRPWVAFVLVNLAWDVLFSPFGAERRFITPFYIITAMAVLAHWQPSARAVQTSTARQVA